MVCVCVCVCSVHIFSDAVSLHVKERYQLHTVWMVIKPGMQLCVGLVSLVSSPGTPLLSHQLGGVLSGNETMTSCTLMLLGLASRLGIRYPNSPLRV